MKNYRAFPLIVALLLVISGNQIIQAQDQPIPVRCGTVIEGEFSAKREQDFYSIELQARDTISVTAKLVVNSQINALIRDPSGSVLFLGMGGKIENLPIGATGTHIIEVHEVSAIGLYTLSIGCVLNNNQVINPGDDLPTPPPTPPASGDAKLIPVTLPGAATIPLISGAPLSGAMAAEGIPPYTYTFNAASGDTLSLQIDRTSGNLNLGVVVLFGQDQILFYGGLIASNTLSTTLTLPSDGQYTIGVFRVDLVPPAAPEATAFQVLGVLNP